MTDGAGGTLNVLVFGVRTPLGQCLNRSARPRDRSPVRLESADVYEVLHASDVRRAPGYVSISFALILRSSKRRIASPAFTNKGAAAKSSPLQRVV